MADQRKKQGRAYYYRMRTLEKRLEKNVRIAAITAVSLVIALSGAFIAAFLLGDAQPDEAAPPPLAYVPPEPQAEDAPEAEEYVLPILESQPGEDGPRLVRDCADCPVMVVVPAGSYIMGIGAQEAAGGRISPSLSATETPAHGVTIREPFALQQTEVTRGQFDAFVRDTEHQSTGCQRFSGETWILDRGRSWRDPGFFQDENHPVVCVSREDAQAYAEWLSKKSGERYRLPTEAEWEYAARAGQTGAYVWGDDLTEACAHANVAGSSHMGHYPGRPTALVFACDSGYAETAPVGKYRINPVGLYDMFGNVREMVADCWNEDYRGAPVDGAARTDGDCASTVVRGGGWSDPPVNLRTPRRLRAGVAERRGDQGFRLARDLEDGTY
jgi:formylglycine-generating enzyme required for sulfatase activity